MTRIFTPAVLGLLLALLLLPACTTTQHNVAATTVCLASVAADIALSVHSHTWAPGGLLGFFVCDLSLATLSNGQGYGETLQAQPIVKDPLQP